MLFESSPKIKEECENIIFYTYGTIKVLRRRVYIYTWLTNTIVIMGFVTPIAYYIMYSFKDSYEGKIEPLIIVLASSVGIVQLVLSLLSLCLRWDDKKYYSEKAIERNLDIYNKVEDVIFSSNPRGDYGLLKEIRKDFKDQEKIDTITALSTKYEHRFAMCNSLYYFRRKCAICQRVPSVETPNRFGKKCNCCGINLNK